MLRQHNRFFQKLVVSGKIVEIERAMARTLPDHDVFLNQIADVLCRHGLRLPALIALEAGRPLSFLGGQLLWVAQPVLALFLPTQTVRQAARLLEEPAAVKALIARLETKKA